MTAGKQHQMMASVCQSTLLYWPPCMEFAVDRTRHQQVGCVRVPLVRSHDALVCLVHELRRCCSSE